MSEQFEHKVHQLLGDIELEPDSEVWQKVQLQIQPEKKKRRFIFWWILPVVLAGAVFTYYFIHNNLDGFTAKADQTKPISNDNISVRDNSKSETIKPQASVSIIEDNRQELIPSIVISPKKYSGIRADQKAKKRTRKFMNGRKVPQANKLSTVETSAGEEQANTATNSIAGKPSKELTDTAITIAKTVPKKELSNSKPEIKDTSDSTVTLPAKKQMEPKKWRFGITTNLGIANASVNESNIPLASFNNIPSSPLVSGGFMQNRQMLNKISGAQYGVGMILQRQINQNMDISSALSYQYHSFAVKDMFYKDSANTRIISYSSTSISRAHSINLSLATNWYLIKTPQIKTGISLAFDNMYLVAADNNVASITYGLSDFQKSNSLAGYNKWQPYLRAGLVSNFTTNQNKVVQISPYFRYGLRSYIEQRLDSKHVWQLGLNINYYFQ